MLKEMINSKLKNFKYSKLEELDNYSEVLNKIENDVSEDYSINNIILFTVMLVVLIVMFSFGLNGILAIFMIHFALILNTLIRGYAKTPYGKLFLISSVFFIVLTIVAMIVSSKYNLSVQVVPFITYISFFYFLLFIW